MKFVRTQLEEEYVSVQLSMVFNIKEMVIPPASVSSSNIFLLIYLTADLSQ